MNRLCQIFVMMACSFAFGMSAAFAASDAANAAKSAGKSAGKLSIKLKPDAPVVKPPVMGNITGVLKDLRAAAGGGVLDAVKLRAVSRAGGKEYRPAVFNVKTGHFAFRKMPGDASYDIVVTLPGGRVIEGIDLEFADARLLRLAEMRRKQLGLPCEDAAGEKFTSVDMHELLGIVRDMKDFMEVRRVLYVRGHGRRATMLVELLRTREFYASKGKIVWRVELWYFERAGGGWRRLPNQERVLRRMRITADKWRKVHVEYFPELSVFVDRRGRARRVKFTIPAAADASRGRPAGTKPDIRTKPHVLGIGEGNGVGGLVGKTAKSSAISGKLVGGSVKNASETPSERTSAEPAKEAATPKGK